MVKVFIIIPAYNESAAITSVIKDIRAASKEWQMVVVDDGSSDRTAELAETAGAVVLRHLVNRGQGAALKTGTEYAIMAGAEVVVHFDADGQFSAVDIPAVIAPLTAGEAQVVFGSRFLSAPGGKKSNIPWFKKHVILGLARLINKIFLGVSLSDPQTGCRAFSKEAAVKLNWQQDKMAHCSEIMRLAVKNNLRVREVPITVVYHSFGQHFSGGVKILEEFFLGIFTK